MSCATQVIVNCWTKPHILHSLIWHLIKVLLNWIWSSYQGVATGAVRGTKAFLLKTPFFNFSAFQHSLDMWGCWVQLQLKIKIMMCICSGKVTTLGHLQPFAKEETNISSRDRDQMGGFPSKANSNITRHISLLFLVSHALSPPFYILAFASIFAVQDFWTKLLSPTQHTRHFRVRPSRHRRLFIQGSDSLSVDCYTCNTYFNWKGEYVSSTAQSLNRIIPGNKTGQRTNKKTKPTFKFL